MNAEVCFDNAVTYPNHGSTAKLMYLNTYADSVFFGKMMMHMCLLFSVSKCDQESKKEKKSQIDPPEKKNEAAANERFLYCNIV